jgi:hypothetical protein
VNDPRAMLHLDPLLRHLLRGRRRPETPFPRAAEPSPVLRHAMELLAHHEQRISDINDAIAGWVYFMRSERPVEPGDDFGRVGPKAPVGMHPWKIGLSTSPASRRATLSTVCGIPLTLVHTISTDDARALEATLHRAFAI